MSNLQERGRTLIRQFATDKICVAIDFLPETEDAVTSFPWAYLYPSNTAVILIDNQVNLDEKLYQEKTKLIERLTNDYRVVEINLEKYNDHQVFELISRDYEQSLIFPCGTWEIPRALARQMILPQQSKMIIVQPANDQFFTVELRQGDEVLATTQENEGYCNIEEEGVYEILTSEIFPHDHLPDPNGFECRECCYPAIKIQ